MTIKTLVSKGLAKRAIARQLSLSEGTVRYHLRRIAAKSADGRARQVRRAAAHRGAIAHWMSAHGDGALNVAALHEWLNREHGYGGSLRSVQRFIAEAYPPPRIRARRRIETPLAAAALAVESLALAGLYGRYSLKVSPANPLVWVVVMGLMAAFVAYGR